MEEKNRPEPVSGAQAKLIYDYWLHRDRLMEAERKLLELRFGVFDGEPKSRQEAAAALGMSGSDFSRMERQIMGVLRQTHRRSRLPDLLTDAPRTSYSLLVGLWVRETDQVYHFRTFPCISSPKDYVCQLHPGQKLLCDVPELPPLTYVVETEQVRFIYLFQEEKTE